MPRAIQASVAAVLADGECSAADLAWAIAQAFEQAGEGKRAAEFYRRVADREPKTDRGKAAAAKANALMPKRESPTPTPQAPR